MKKWNLSKLNSSFFLMSIALSVIFTLISAFIFEIDLTSAFLLMLISSFTADAICFYRLNNGLIAILRGRFAKPSRKNLHFVDYESNTYAPSPAEKGKSLFVYKLNSRNAYQIIPLSDRFLVHRIYPDKEESKIITDFNKLENQYVHSKDIEILYSAIKGVTYSLSENNFYLPILSINTGNKRFRYIGCFEELKDNEIKAFFADKAKVKIKDKHHDREKRINTQQKDILFYNILTLLACTIVPQSVFSRARLDDGYRHILSSAYILLSLIILIIYILMPIIRSDKYTINIAGKAKRKSKDISAGQILVLLCLTISVNANITIISRRLYFIFALILFIIICTMYFKTHMKQIKKAVRSDKICFIFEIIFLSVFAATTIVISTNYLIPIESSEQAYTVLDLHREPRRYTDDYYATIRMGTKERDIEISEELYNKSPSLINVKRQKGLLGIEYAYNNN